jgi:AsmA protein
MRPAVRRTLLVVAVLFGVLVLAVLALPYLVSLDAMRARIVGSAEAALHRKVDVGRVRLKILSGLGAGVEKVVVHNKPGSETPALLTADEVSVKVAFWPLLRKRVEVRRLVLDGVSVAIERDPSGALNVSDFLSAGGRESQGAAESAAAALLVSRVEIRRGRALFVDRKFSPGKTVTTSLEDFGGRISDVGPSTPIRFDLAARFLADTGRNLALQGTFGPLPTTGDPVGLAPLKASFAAKDVALARLGPYVEALATTDTGRLTLSGNAEGAPLGTLSVVGRATLVPAAGAAGSKIPAADGTYRLTIDWPSGALAITDTLLSVANLPLAIEGRVDGLRKETRVVDLRAKTPGEVAIDSVTGLPGIAGRLPAGVKLGGRVRFRSTITGPTSDLDTQASLDAAPFSVTTSQGPMLEAASAVATLGRRGNAPMSGRITIPSGKLRAVPFQDLAADWTWNAGALTLAPSASLYGGTLRGRVQSDFAHPETPSRLSLNVEGVKAQPLLESATTLRDVFAGSLDGRMDLESRGLSWDAVSRTGRGQGRLTVADADLRTVKLMPEVARALSAVGQVAGFQVPASLESTRFSKLETSLALSDGRVATPDLTLEGPDVSASADGSIGLDRTLAYQGRIVLGPSIVKSLGQTGRYVADAQGRIALPFRASGPIASPKVAIDESIVLELGRRVLARQAGERVGGTAGAILGNVLEGGGGEGGGQTTSPGNILQQLLGRPPTPTPTARPRP